MDVPETLARPADLLSRLDRVPVFEREQRVRVPVLEVADRDEWLKALADLRRKGVEIVQGPLIHGPEGGSGPGNAFGGSGSRSFYFLDPDGNRLELYTDMMKVPEGEQFPRAEYADANASADATKVEATSRPITSQARGRAAATCERRGVWCCGM